MIKIKSWQLGAAVLVVIFGGVLASAAFDWWHTESTKTPVKFESGEATGAYNPADIRGSYTFGEISDLFAIPLEDLVAAFQIPADVDASAFACKDLESLYTDLAESGMEIGTSSVRLFVAFYKGLPYDLSTEESYLLKPAVQILKQNSALTPEQAAYLDAHAVVPGSGVVAPAAAEPAGETAPGSTSVPTSEDHVQSSDRLVKGKTTFREVLDWGVPQETIEQIIGGSMPNPLTLVKDYCAAQGLEFASIKTALQAAVDAVAQP